MNASIRSASARTRFSLDTNVLIYSINASEAAKHAVAATIVDAAVDSDCVLTLQSISDFYWAVTRKRMMPSVAAAELAENWLTIFPLVGYGVSAIKTALGEAVAGRTSYWDALLLATASEAECTMILSEDMADSRVLGGVQIHNPFTEAPALTDLTRQLLGR